MPLRPTRLVASALIAGLGLALLPLSAAQAETIYDTSAGGGSIALWGPSQTPTYGQTVTAPATDSSLTSFTFHISAQQGPIVFRGEVFAWDDTAKIATGAPLWVSEPQTAPNGSDAVYTFSPHVALVPGGTYVLLGTVLGETQSNADGSAYWYTARNPSAIAGTAVYTNHGASWLDETSDPSYLTSTPWDGRDWGDDLAMRIVWDASTPTVTATSITSGSTHGGDTVVITGSSFTDATDVSFGDIAADFTVDSDTQITATTPAHAAGDASIVVTTPAGASDGTDFTYVTPAPAVTALSPTSGTVHGGESVVLTGTDLTGATDVSFGDTPADFTVDSDSQITATAPAHAQGTASIVVTTPAGSSEGVDYGYAVPVPAVTALSATSGSSTGGQKVVLTGTDLTTVTSVTFGGTAATFTVDSDTQITATAPKHLRGAASVIVTSPSGSSIAQRFAYVDPAKKLPISVATTQLVAGQHETVTAKGLLAGEPYTLTFHGKKIGSGTASAAGVVSRTFYVPKDVAGTVTVKVTGSNTKRSGTTSVVVLAKSKKLGVHFSPSPIVEANRTVTVKVTGLGAHEKVTVRFRGAIVSAKGATATAAGTYTVSFSAGWSWGYKKVTATGAAVTRTGSANIDVEARHNPQRIF